MKHETGAVRRAVYHFTLQRAPEHFRPHAAHLPPPDAPHAASLLMAAIGTLSALADRAPAAFLAMLETDVDIRYAAAALLLVTLSRRGPRDIPVASYGICVKQGERLLVQIWAIVLRSHISLSHKTLGRSYSMPPTKPPK